ncbi:cytochrome P450, partial [Mycobacterium sp. ITM-2017-0098]
MTTRDTAAPPEVGSLPLVPRNPLPLWRLVQLVRRLDTGQEVIRDAGGPITRIQLGPKTLMPPIVAVMSPAGMRDVLGRNDASSDRCIIHEQVQEMAGDSLWVLPNEQWR